MASFFLSHQIYKFSKIYDISLFTNLEKHHDLLDWVPENVNVVNISINREVSLISDFKVLFQLILLFYKSNFMLVHSVSPKAGLLAMMASFINFIPVRIHTFTGQVWSTKEGFFKRILKWIDYLIGILSTEVIVDSYSQQCFLINENIISKSKSIVFGKGSISGVDLEKFKFNVKTRKELRTDLSLSEDTIVFLFVGRIKKEKGILELLEAFSKIRELFSKIELWIVGPDEDNLIKTINDFSKIRLFPLTKNPEKYMISSDILCLPSYREGFGTVIIEAGACGIPSIGSDIYGLKDAIKDGETGILVKKKSIDDLVQAMILLVEDKDLRKKLAKGAKEYVQLFFSQDLISKELLDFYSKKLEKVST